MLYNSNSGLAAGVGRIGCFLSGLPDGTYGLPSSLPWAIDLGDEDHDTLRLSTNRLSCLLLRICCPALRLEPRVASCFWP